MGKKCCCERQVYHVHTYCITTDISDCHRHKMWGVTSAELDTPCHTHKYEGITSCNDGHEHHYHGCTGECEPTFCGHVHNFCGKTSREDHHKHCYQGRTGKDKIERAC